MRFLRNFVLLLVAGTFHSTMGAGREVDSIATYYAFKNRAELAIVDSAYPTAQALYDSAFFYKRPHEKDLYNAFILSCLLADTIKAKLHFNELVALGLTKSGLAADLQFAKVDTNLVYFIDSDYDSIRSSQEYRDRERVALTMDSMYEFDQGIRRYEAQFFEPGGGPSKFDDSIITVDSINVSRMIKRIKENGFPDIYQTGFLAAHYIHISSYSMLFLLARHTTDFPEFREGRAEFMWLLLKAVKEGNFDPRDYAFLYDESHDSNTYGSVLNYSYYEDNRVLVPMAQDEIDRINAARRSIHLESLDEYQRKLQFVGKRSPFQYSLVNVFVMAYNNTTYAPASKKN